MQQEAPKEEVERLITEAGGVKSLVGYLHGFANIHKSKKGTQKSEKASNSDVNGTRACPTDVNGTRACPIPDGLPKSREELEEEEKARMPDSPFTRLLRAKGTHPAWYQ